MTGLEGAERVRRHLADRGIPYEVAEHRQAITAQELAAAEHTPGRRVAKAVLLMTGDHLAMVVLAAPDHVSLAKAKEVLAAGEVRLATEAEFGQAFPDCELGAAPPFGNVYGLPTYLDERLAAAETIVFAAGSHTHSAHMAMADYLAAAEPKRADLAVA